MQTTTINRDDLLDSLGAFVHQKPGFESANYGGDRSLYLQDYRPTLQHLHDAEKMLAAVRWRESITTEDIISASHRAFFGRLEISADANGRPVIDYTPGQYAPTEYRAAVCAVLAAALWAYWRRDMEPGSGHAIRRKAVDEFGRGIARRWFDA